MGEGLDGLGLINVITNPDQPAAEVREAVRATEVHDAADIESPFLEEALEAIPQPERGLAGEEGRLADLGVG